MKNINDYVTKNETLITGEIKLNDELKDIINPEGTIYGEVWYNITVEYPYYFYQEEFTKNSQKNLSLTFLNNRKYLIKPYRFYQEKTNRILTNKYLPIYLSIDEQIEMKMYETMCMEIECSDLALHLGLKKIKDKLQSDEYIINYKILQTKFYEDKLVQSVFVTVYESIGEYR